MKSIYQPLFKKQAPIKKPATALSIIHDYSSKIEKHPGVGVAKNRAASGSHEPNSSEEEEESSECYDEAEHMILDEHHTAT